MSIKNLVRECVDELESNVEITASSVAKHSNFKPQQVSGILSELCQKGVLNLVRTEPTASGRLMRNVYVRSARAKPKISNRQVVIATIESMRDDEKITSRIVADLTGFTTSYVAAVICELRNEGKLFLVNDPNEKTMTHMKKPRSFEQKELLLRDVSDQELLNRLRDVTAEVRRRFG